MSGIIVLSNEADRNCAIWASPYDRLLGSLTVRTADFSPAQYRFDSCPGYLKGTAKKQKKKVTYDVSLVLLARPFEIILSTRTK